MSRGQNDLSKNVGLKSLLSPFGTNGDKFGDKLGTKQKASETTPCRNKQGEM